MESRENDMVLEPWDVLADLVAAYESNESGEVDRKLALEGARKLLSVRDQYSAPSSGALEPVGYLYKCKGHTDEFGSLRLTDGDKAAGWSETPLYIAPPVASTGEVVRVLQDGLFLAVSTLAFLGRDRGTSRLDKTLDDLEELARKADIDTRTVLATMTEATDKQWLAPFEPTDEMVSEAVYNTNRKYNHDPVDATIVREVYSAMRYARPITQPTLRPAAGGTIGDLEAANRWAANISRYSGVHLDASQRTGLGLAFARHRLQSLADAQAEITRLRERLELTGDFAEGPDGIECRDDTIRLLDERVAHLKSVIADLSGTKVVCQECDPPGSGKECRGGACYHCHGAKVCTCPHCYSKAKNSDG